MSDNICKECGDPLKYEEDWILRDAELLGTIADQPLSECYIHRDCATDEQIREVVAGVDNQLF